MMKKILLALPILLIQYASSAQVTNLAPGEYKSIDIGWNNYGDFTKTLILLHEAYDQTLLGSNFAIGTIQARRGSTASFNRLNTVNITTASAYNGNSASLVSNDNNEPWKLKTCMYNGKKYMAVEVPFSNAYHDYGYKFTGWASSTGELMKAVSYEVAGQPVNQGLISNIQDFTSDMVETHETNMMKVTGRMGIGTMSPDPSYHLSVNGKIRAKEVMVESNWADFVFKPGYTLMPLSELEKFIRENQHLPGIPDEKTVQREGVNLGETDTKLLQKIEELTLYLIEMKNMLEKQQMEIDKLKNQK